MSIEGLIDFGMSEYMSGGGFHRFMGQAYTKFLQEFQIEPINISSKSATNTGVCASVISINQNGVGFSHSFFFFSYISYLKNSHVNKHLKHFPTRDVLLGVPSDRSG